MSNAVKNIIRTAVPAIIGTFAAYWAKVSGKLDTTQFAGLVPLITTAYYAAVRFTEERYPKFSWLLGALPVQAAVVPAATLPLAEVPAPPKTLAAPPAPPAA